MGDRAGGRGVVAAVNPRPAARVLDVATGTGIDYVPALVATAKRRAEAERLGVEFKEADPEPFRSRMTHSTMSSRRSV